MSPWGRWILERIDFDIFGRLKGWDVIEQACNRFGDRAWGHWTRVMRHSKP